MAFICEGDAHRIAAITVTSKQPPANTLQMRQANIPHENVRSRSTTRAWGSGMSLWSAGSVKTCWRQLRYEIGVTLQSIPRFSIANYRRELFECFCVSNLQIAELGSELPALIHLRGDVRALLGFSPTSVPEKISSAECPKADSFDTLPQFIGLMCCCERTEVSPA